MENIKPIADYYFILLENLVNAYKISSETLDGELFKKLLVAAQQCGEDAYVEHCERYGDEPLPKYYTVLFSAVTDAIEQSEQRQYRQALSLLLGGFSQSLALTYKS